jgi:hypothetical protein
MEYKPVDSESLRKTVDTYLPLDPRKGPAFQCVAHCLDEIDFLRKALAQAVELGGIEYSSPTGRKVLDRVKSRGISAHHKSFPELAAYLAHGTEPSDSEPKASSTGEDGRSQEAADGGKAVMEEAND